MARLERSEDALTNGCHLNTQLAYWSRMSGHYDEHYGIAQRHLAIGRKAFLIAHLAGMKQGSMVLEVGCGTGAYSEFYQQIAGRGLSVSDLSPEMVAICQSKTEANGFAADIHILPCNGDTYDAVVGSYVLQYTNLPEALAEVKRVLKPGGRAVFLETNTLNPYVFLRTHLAPWAFGVVKGATSFRQSEMAEAINRSGLVCEGIVPADVSRWCLGIPGAYVYQAEKPEQRR